MIIRLATLDDINGIYEVEEESFSVPWSKESIENDIASEDRAYYVVIEVEDEIVAYAGIWWVADEGQITNIAVKKAHRRKGYGAMLTRKLIKESWKAGINEVFLEVRVSNVAALSLYRRMGFTVKGVRKNYYADPIEDAYIMSLVGQNTEEK